MLCSPLADLVPTSRRLSSSHSAIDTGTATRSVSLAGGAGHDAVSIRAGAHPVEKNSFLESLCTEVS